MLQGGQNPGWDRLYIQGRCKFRGVPRSPEERQQIMSAPRKELKIAELRKEGGKHDIDVIVEKKAEKARLEEKKELLEKVMVQEAVVETHPNDALLKAQEDYKRKFNRELPPRFKNDLEWLNSKLAEVL